MSKLGSLLRAGAELPRASGPSPPAQQNPSLGLVHCPLQSGQRALPALRVKAETQLSWGHSVQGMGLACRLGMAGTIFMDLAKASLLEIIFPVALLN